MNDGNEANWEESYTIGQLNSPLHDIFIGSVAGALGKIIEYPFDTVKVRLQTHDVGTFPTTWSCIKYTYDLEGIRRGFLQGITSPVIGAAMETAVLFVAYNQTARYLEHHYKNISDLQNILISGGVAGTCVSFVLTPVELVKCKLQVVNIQRKQAAAEALHKHHTRILPTILSIIKEDGVLGMWRGLTGTFLRETVGGVAWFGTYETLKHRFRERHPEEGNKTWELLLSGASAGVAFNCTIYPVDTVKTVTQVRNESFQQALRKVVARRGILGLYRGFGITCFRAIPANSVVFFTYEKLSKWLGPTI